MSPFTPPTYTVSELNQHVKQLLEHTHPIITVSGEISNLSRPSSGHAYFTLKDDKAQIRCAFFKMHQRGLATELKAGMQVWATGKVSLFEARGDYQLIVQQVEDAGAGLLHQQFEALKKKLQAEGLFSSQYKKPIPPFPQHIAIITSPKGAALRDILITLYKRFPLSSFTLYPCEVQGQNAAPQLQKAIQSACQAQEADVILLARGGGSIEDLWAFNDEALARTLFEAPIPIVTGIGHETDFTIADFVSDLRAATPTAAAMALTPDQNGLKDQLQAAVVRLQRWLTQHLQTKRTQLSHYQTRLTTSCPKLTQQSQSIDYLETQLQQALNWHLHQKNAAITPLYQRLQQHSPHVRIHSLLHQQQSSALRLKNGINTLLNAYKNQLQLQAKALNAYSPLQILDRGYSIATHQEKVIKSADEVKPNDEIELRLAKGKLTCLVSASSPTPHQSDACLDMENA